MSGIKINNGGSFTNTGSITGVYYGVEIYGGVGSVTNSTGASITATGAYKIAVYLEDGGDVTNQANATITGSTGICIAGATGTVTNAGLISENTAQINLVGVELNAGGAVYNLTGASIYVQETKVYGSGGSTDAIGVEVTGASGSVTNNGAITAYGGGGVGIYLKAGGTITNTGKILASGVSVYYNYNGYFENYRAGYAIKLTNGGSITNSASGIIESKGACGIVAFNGSTTITNFGLITNPSYPYQQIIYAAISLSGTSANITNGKGGVISSRGGSAIMLYTENATITNAGAIMGNGDAIDFFGDQNSLTLQTGSMIDGNVVGSLSSGANNALILEGRGSANNEFFNFNTLTVQATQMWTLGGSFKVGATIVSTGELHVVGAITTAVSEAASTWIAIGGALTLNGSSTLNGKTVGLGTLAQSSGTMTIASGAKFTVARWLVTNATATFGEALTYAGRLSAGAGSLFDLTGGALNLTGSAVFKGSSIAGANALIDDATTTVIGLTIGGTGGFSNSAALTEVGGQVVLGDTAGDIVMLTNATSGVWNIADGSGITLGKSTAASISNLGLFEKTGGGASLIAPAIANSGKVQVSAGTLDLQGAETGKGGDFISSAATLEYDSTVSAHQTINFTGSGGVLDLGSPTGFSGAISGFDATGFGSNDSVELLGSWAISGYTQNSASVGTLTLIHGGHKASLIFDGAYTQSLFGVSLSGASTILTYAGTASFRYQSNS